MLSSARVLVRLGRGMSQRLIVTEASLGLTHVMGELRERHGRHMRERGERDPTTDRNERSLHAQGIAVTDEVAHCDGGKRLHAADKVYDRRTH